MTPDICSSLKTSYFKQAVSTVNFRCQNFISRVYRIFRLTPSKESGRAGGQYPEKFIVPTVTNLYDSGQSQFAIDQSVNVEATPDASPVNFTVADEFAP